jgi:hypothetical protein
MCDTSGTRYPSFTGQQQDTVAGWDDFLSREYSPAQGRWSYLSGVCVMQLRSYVMLAILAVGVGAGCTSARNVDLKPDSFVGDYVYRSADQGSPHHPDKVSLKADGKYVLVHMPAGHQGSTEQGKWQLINKPVPSIAFGDTLYPVEAKRNKVVRLLIDDDLGWSYEKTQ